MEAEKNKGIEKELISVIFFGFAIACLMLGMASHGKGFIIFGDILVMGSVVFIGFGLGILLEWVKVV